MHRLIPLALVAVLGLAAASEARAEEEGSLPRLEERVRALLEQVADLQQQVAALRARLAERESAQEPRSPAPEPPPPAQPPEPDRTGLVPVPRSTRTIPAYALVTRDYLIDATGALQTLWMKPEDVAALGIVPDLPKIVGRVLKREKPPGYVFTEADFYPKGTRPGPVAAVPPGMRALRVRTSTLPGVHDLKQFDHFDVVMAVAREEARPGEEPAGPQDAGRARRVRTEARTIVEDGFVIVPPTTRTPAVPLSRWGTPVVATPVEEVVIALDPDEVTALQLALAAGARLQVALRSGQPSDEEAAEKTIPDRGWVLVVDAEIVEEAPLTDEGEHASSWTPGDAERARAEAIGVWVYDLEATIEALVAAGSPDAPSPEEEAVIRVLLGANRSGAETDEMVLELAPDGTFTQRATFANEAPMSTTGRWSVVGRHIALLTTHENGQELDVPGGPLTGTCQHDRITLRGEGNDFVMVFLRETR